MTPEAPAPEDLYQAPNALARHYSRFRVSERLLLTGHSHQAWPNCGFDGQAESWSDAAEFVDQKWDHAFERAEQVRAGYRRMLDDANGEIALGSSTHELGVRFLSALPLRKRPKIVTTDGEFHSLRRQLERLAEESMEIVKIAALPTSTLADRICAAIDDRTAAAIVSSVLFRNALIVPHLGQVAETCRQVGAEMLVDAYHTLNVVPFSVVDEGLESAFVTGGGYKYCQLGEGNCFLRVPPDCALRPVITGWFAEFEDLSLDTATHGVRYGAGAARFAGSTYDPTSHYRAARVFQFFESYRLTPRLLREVSQHQIRVLSSAFDALDVDPDVVARDRNTPPEQLGGFLALETRHAARLHQGLLHRGVSTDWRDMLLRFGPAPYLTDDQLLAAMAALGESVAGMT